MKDDRLDRVAALANAEAYNAASVGTCIDGFPHLKHASLRTLYGKLVAQVYDLAAQGGTVPRVLDLGAGEGSATLQFLELGASVLAIDISERQLAELKTRCAAYHGRLEIRCEDVLSAVHSMDQFFDIAVANSFLHHVPDYLSLIHRVLDRLRPGGIFFSFQDPLRYDSLPFHHHLFSLLAYGIWRFSGGDVIGGIGRRLRRCMGVYRDDVLEDNTEYHAVRNGVDQDAIMRLLASQGFDGRVVKYFSTQSIFWQSIGERFGVCNAYAIVAQRRQQRLCAEYAPSWEKSMNVMRPEGVVVRTTCRSCESKTLIPVMSLGNQYVSAFIGPDEPPEQQPRVPLELVFCDESSGGCGLLQLKHTTPPLLLYQRYWYRSVINSSMRQALADITCSAESLVPLTPGDVVLDIGCNDGTLLRSYTAKGVKLTGFEPASNLVEDAAVGTHAIINEFFNFSGYQRVLGAQKAKIVTSIAMFYDLEDPNAFTKDIARILASNGVWIIQMSYLPSMLQQNAFDNICHEHLEYYSLHSLRRLIERHGLEIFDVELNDVNGGSFRAYIRHRGDAIGNLAMRTGRVRALDQSEATLALGAHNTYEEFAQRVNRLREALCGFLKQQTSAGRRIYGYGASTKGNTLLQYYGLTTSTITAILEANPDKWGHRTVGSWIPIISEEEGRAQHPDYLLVLPWHFLEGFKAREHRFLEAGGRFIVPLPDFQVVGV